jgi:hypothetical protein
MDKAGISILVSGFQAEAAAAAGESSFRSFMIAVQRCASSVAILQQVSCRKTHYS